MRRMPAGRRALVPLVVAVLGIAALAAGQDVTNRHRMEDNLTSRSQRALAGAGLSTVDVSFTGRDGTLHAQSRADADRALAIVRTLDGVRVASAVVDERPAPPVQRQPPTVTIALTGGALMLTGTVPSTASRTALVNAGGVVFGTDKVTDHLTVADTVTEDGVAGLADVVTAFGKETTDASAQLSDGTLTLQGTVSTQSTADALREAANRAVGAAHVVDQLTVVAVQQQLIAIPPITFVTGSSTLTLQGQQALVSAAAVLNANPAVRVRIEGNTDSNGTATANLVLSQARAQTVLDTLVSLGVARDRLTAVGYGESRPKVPDTSPANQAINRRVDFVVLP